MDETKRIPESKIADKRLGRHVEHDPRSRKFAYEPVMRASDLRTVHYRRYGVLDQGDLGSCTGNAAAGAINTDPIHPRHTKLLTEVQAVSIYSLATKLDPWPGEYPPEDTGSSGLAAAKALQMKGHITSYRHAFSMEEALSALMLKPVITGVNWYEGFDNPAPDGLVNIAGEVRGGHEFEIIGFQTGRNWSKGLEDSLVIAVNSWGYRWGKKGRFMFTVATWRQLLAENGDVTILDA